MDFIILHISTKPHKKLRQYGDRKIKNPLGGGGDIIQSKKCWCYILEFHNISIFISSSSDGVRGSKSQNQVIFNQSAGENETLFVMLGKLRTKSFVLES